MQLMIISVWTWRSRRGWNKSQRLATELKVNWVQNERMMSQQRWECLQRMLTHGKTFGSLRWNKVMNSGGSPAEGLKTRSKRIGESDQTCWCIGRDMGSRKVFKRGHTRIMERKKNCWSVKISVWGLILKIIIRTVIYLKVNQILDINI